MTIEAGASHTNWALIDEARGDGAAAGRAVEQLVRRYWPAVYAYIRQSGGGVDRASDLTQGFICEIMLGKNLFVVADPKRGRFRTLLLTSLQNFLRDQQRKDKAAVRSPATKILQLDSSQMEQLAARKDLTPEQAFSVQWHATLITRVLERVRAGCAASGLDAHWRVFEARVVKPMLFGEAQATYPKLVELLELDDSGQAANMMVTVKRRFVRALIEEVGCTVENPTHVEEELRALLNEIEAHL